MAQILLTKAFAVADGKIPDIGALVKGFDFSKMSVTDTTNDDYLHCDLAPSFGKLNAETVQKLDDQLKIMIVGLTKQIGQVPAQERSWEKIVSLCAQSPVIEPADDGIAKTDSFTRNSSSEFKTNGSPDDGIVKEVVAWFRNFIGDEDVLNSTKIDIDVLGRIVAQSGATIDSFETFFKKTERHRKNVLDIGILRYPDIDNPYFKIYRIKLSAWSDSERILFHQEDRNGITGEYDVRKYKPRSSVIEGLRKSAHDNAINEANNLFS